MIKNSELSELMRKDRRFVNYAKVRLANGAELDLTPSNFRISNSGITDRICESGLSIGNAIAKSITISIDNTNREFENIDFYMAEIYLQVCMYRDDTHETRVVIQKGRYTVTQPETEGAVINITAVDDMYRFDKPYKPGISYSKGRTTYYQILADCCTKCGVGIGFPTNFTNANVPIQITQKPDNVTFRDIVGFVAAIAGCNARISVDNTLELLWFNYSQFPSETDYDGGTYLTKTQPYSDGATLDGGTYKTTTTPYSDGDSANGGTYSALNVGTYNVLYSFKNLKLGTTKIKVTGVKIKNGSTESIKGTESYCLEITDNPLTVDNTSNILPDLERKLIRAYPELNFVTFSGTMPADPRIEAGDVAIVIDRYGKKYKTIITDVKFKVGGYTEVSCNAQEVSRNGVSYSDSVARKVASTTEDLQEVISTNYTASLEYTNEKLTEAKSYANSKSLQDRMYTDNVVTEYDTAVSKINSLAINSMGYYQTTITDKSTGAKTSYIHNNPKLEDSKYQYMINASGFFISQDYGKTWKEGVDAITGDATLNILNAVGINAQWIKAGTMTIGGVDSSDGITIIDYAPVDYTNKNLIYDRSRGSGGTSSSQARTSGGILYSTDKYFKKSLYDYSTDTYITYDSFIDFITINASEDFRAKRLAFKFSGYSVEIKKALPKATNYETFLSMGLEYTYMDNGKVKTEIIRELFEAQEAKTYKLETLLLSDRLFTRDNYPIRFKRFFVDTVRLRFDTNVLNRTNVSTSFFGGDGTSIGPRTAGIYFSSTDTLDLDNLEELSYFYDNETHNPTDFNHTPGKSVGEWTNNSIDVPGFRVKGGQTKIDSATIEKSLHLSSDSNLLSDYFEVNKPYVLNDLTDTEDKWSFFSQKSVLSGSSTNPYTESLFAKHENGAVLSYTYSASQKFTSLFIFGSSNTDDIEISFEDDSDEVSYSIPVFYSDSPASPILYDPKGFTACDTYTQDSEPSIYAAYTCNAIKFQNGTISREMLLSAIYDSIYSVSDERVKIDIKPLENAKNVILSLNPISFRYNFEYNSDEDIHYGFTAQNVKQALEDNDLISEGVVYEHDDILRLDKDELHAFEVECIKDLYDIVKKQQEEIELLKTEIKILKGDK